MTDTTTNATACTTCTDFESSLAEQLRQLPLPQSVQDQLQAFIDTLGSEYTDKRYIQVLRAACKYPFPDNILGEVVANLPCNAEDAWSNCTWQQFIRDGLLAYFRTPCPTTYVAHIDMRVGVRMSQDAPVMITDAVSAAQSLPYTIKKGLEAWLDDFKENMGPLLKDISYSCRYNEGARLHLKMVTIYPLDDDQMGHAHEEFEACLRESMAGNTYGGRYSQDDDFVRRFCPHLVSVLDDRSQTVDFFAEPLVSRTWTRGGE